MPATRSRSAGREAVRRPRPRSDAYTGLLILSLMALTVALVFAYLNWSEFPDKTPKVTAGGAPPAAGPVVPQGGAPGAPQPPGGPGGPGGPPPGQGGRPPQPPAPPGGPGR